jgi:hypothetical protein
VCSLTGLGIYLALGLRERLFVDWVIQISVLDVLIAALCWPLIHRQPRNGAVWALLWVAVTTSTQALATGLLQQDLAALGRSPDLARIVPAELPLTTALAHQTASWGWVAGNFAFLLALMVFPDGRLPSPRWRTRRLRRHARRRVRGHRDGVDRTAGSSVTPMSDDVVAALSPGGQLAMAAALTIGIVAVIVAFAALVARYRASTGQVRAQLRWIAWATGLLVVEGLVLFPLMYAGPEVDLYRYTSTLTFAVFLGAYVVAISRYRLYEIDRLISRTVGYGIVTALLAGVYVSSVLAAQAVVGTGREERSSSSSPGRRCSSPRCSGRSAAAPSRSSTGASTGTCPTGRRSSPPSGSGCATRSRSGPSPRSCGRPPRPSPSPGPSGSGCLRGATDPHHGRGPAAGRAGRTVGDAISRPR